MDVSVRDNLQLVNKFAFQLHLLLKMSFSHSKIGLNDIQFNIINLNQDKVNKCEKREIY